MSSLRNAYSRAKLEAVKGMESKEKSIFLSQEDIFNARVDYGDKEYWKYIRDRFMKEHGTEILDTDKLILHFTVSDNIMRIAGHIGYSLGEPKV